MKGIGRLCFFLAMPVFAQPGSPVNMPEIQALWQQWTTQLSAVRSDRLIAQQQLNCYPQHLLLPESQYPDLTRYDWSELKLLYQIQRHCDVETAIPRDLHSASWLQAVAFERRLCRGEDFGGDWDEQWSALHPAGGSYADRYLAYLQQQPDLSQSHIFYRQHTGSLTLANPEHPLHQTFSGLSAAGQTAILGGYRYYLAKDGRLWRSHPQGIDVLEAEQWQPIAARVGLSVASTRQTAGQSCAMQYSNLCLSPVTQQRIWWQVVLMVLLVLASGMAVHLLLERRRTMKERQFILQLLTHELRTPVASLGFTVEQFRDQFDDLSTAAQDAFYRLSADFQRLSRLTETSQGFLSDQRQAMKETDAVLFSDWLTAVTESYSLDYELEGDRELALPYYWLGVCLDNLLRNAFIHGQPPVTLRASIESNRVWIEVCDQGQSPFRWSFARSPSVAGMGVGLMIVRRLMRRFGGRLIHRRHPTRYRLELPL
ncbi:DUF3404 domain-containing protein (plasmid) [Photobacterium sp. GJ3]|uniref:ATP-binding protein n=1 Tax=Photobacterium sp. GJ3 TaxID=2829502 RepID=UPI001B8D7885|nr:DUF3404 domain-containing protein [Photobacterium sp. GJ3]QUJ70186.1 DUF3404 domain-containing protein [Photobacterium sp. GJ3]